MKAYCAVCLKGQTQHFERKEAEAVKNKSDKTLVFICNFGQIDYKQFFTEVLVDL